MPLLGKAAMLLVFDVLPDAIAEHDDWHTHEHLPERLSIPGFLRGTRWVAAQDGPRYFALYEVADLGILTSQAYLERLNHPTPWTTKMMASYRGMTRGFCKVTGSFGTGIGQAARLVRFRPAANAADALRHWLLHEVLGTLASKPGVGSAHLLESAAPPPMTSEQKIRGADAPVDWALVVAGYDGSALGAPDRTQLAQQGAADVIEGDYRLHYSLTRDG